MEIRKATYEETQKILDYALEVSVEATVGYIKPTVEKAKQMAHSFLKNGGYYVIYTKNNVIQGWIGLGTSYDMYSDNWIGFIQELYVFPSFRKHGIAKRLLQAAEEHFKENGCNEVHLNVFAGNPAKQLYHKLGYTDVSTMMKKGL